MSENFKIIFVVNLIIGMHLQEINCRDLGLEKVNYQDNHEISLDNKELNLPKTTFGFDYYTQKLFNSSEVRLPKSIMVRETKETLDQLINHITQHQSLTEPIKVDWKVLIEIRFKLRYLKEHEMEMYVPIFTKAAKALQGKEVIIKGYVIPFDENGKLLSLSFNPYASCYHCGKGSPASIISLKLKNKSKRYRIDDFKKFRGTLHLNYDDLDEFYYILRDAEEI